MAPDRRETSSYRHPCNVCGRQIISVRMQSGGWSHFESAKGLEMVKHACKTLGHHLSKKRDELTLDMFGDAR